LLLQKDNSLKIETNLVFKKSVYLWPKNSVNINRDDDRHGLDINAAVLGRSGLDRSDFTLLCSSPEAAKPFIASSGAVLTDHQTLHQDFNATKGNGFTKRSQHTSEKS